MKLMKRSPLRVLTVAIMMMFFMAVAPVSASSAVFYHTVIFWLKPDTPKSKVDEIVESIKSLETLPMVEKVMAGTPVMSERTVVDDSFSIAFTMIFKDEAALSAYSEDPTHKKISTEVTMPHVDRGIIYDYKAQ